MSEPSKVLLVEPDTVTRGVLRAAIEGSGRSVTTVPALPREPLDGVDLVIFGLMDDDDATEKLATLRRLFGCPIVALCSPADDQQLGAAYDHGADDVVFRPVRPAELLARIRAQLRLSETTSEIARKQRDAQVLLELTQTLASSLDFRDILFTVVQRIAQVVDVDRVSIVLAPERDSSEVGYVVVTSDDEFLENLRLDLNKYPEIRRVLETREPLTIKDAATHPVLDGVRDDMGHVRLSAMALLPVVWDNEAIGVLFLRARPERGALAEREISFCRTIANATAVALRNARVMQSLRDHTQKVTFARFEAERRLRALKRYADLFASAADGIAVLDVDARFLFANPRAYEISGVDEESFKDREVKDILHPDDHELAQTTWHGLRAGTYPRGIDLRLVTPKGAVVVCNCSFAPLLDGDGAILVSFRDVTEERRTEAELVQTKDFLERLIESSVDGIVAADMRGRIILFNKGAERIYGYSREEAVGKLSVKRLYPDDGAREVMKLILSPHHGGRGRLENIRLDALTAEGEIVPITLSAAVIYEDGKPAATFGIFTDLREKLRVEERLALAQQKLAVTEKQALIAELAGTAAHELNQPLTSVMGYAELLKRRLEHGTTEFRAADIIVHEADRMADIVRKIGKITKYETKSYVGHQKILDLEKASEGGPPIGSEKLEAMERREGQEE